MLDIDGEGVSLMFALSTKLEATIVKYTMTRSWQKRKDLYLGWQALRSRTGFNSPIQRTVEMQEGKNQQGLVAVSLAQLINRITADGIIHGYVRGPIN